MAEYKSFEEFEVDFERRIAEAQAVFLDELQVECQERWKALGEQRLKATAIKYRDNVRVERTEDAVVITVPKGIPSAVDAGTNAFGLAGGFFDPKTRTENLERGNTVRWKTISVGGKKRHIPIDGGWPEKSGGNWQHPGIKPRNITKTALRETERNVLPNLKRDFIARVTV